MERHAVVIGAGPAGLTVTARLVATGATVSLLDRAEAVGSSWRSRYDGLRLNTVRWQSQLPGYRIPARMGRWVGRDEFVEYLELYAEHHRLRLQPGVTVQRIDPAAGGRPGWLVTTDRGQLTASGVVVATGAFDTPVTPAWPGLAQFRGDCCHAADYRRPTPYRGRSVLVVGAGATGLEIAALLVDGGAANVYLSARSCQNIFTRQWRGVPLTPPRSIQHLPTSLLDVGGKAIHRLLGRDWPSPLPPPSAGLGTAMRRDGHEPVVADGVVAALRAGRIRLLPAVADFHEHEVILADGDKIRPDAVVLATGFTHQLGSLVGHLGVLGPTGLPVVGDGGPIAAAPGLAFIGFAPTVTGRLLRIPSQARRAAQTVTNAQHQ